MTESEKPLVTFALFAYNQATFIKEAIEGALTQDYSPLEIIISDDDSTDNTFEIISQTVSAYKGRHTVRLNRNEENLGLANHVNKIFSIAQGDLIVMAAGDDVSVSSRVSSIAEIFESATVMLIHSAVTKIDGSGRKIGVWTPPLVEKQMSLNEIFINLESYIGATGAINKYLYLTYGPIAFPAAYEDLVYCARAALNKNSIIYIDKPLVNYRMGFGITSDNQSGSQNIANALHKRQQSLIAQIDVYSQRLKDLRVQCEIENHANLQNEVNKRLKHHKIRLYLYINWRLLCASFFSRDILLTIKIIAQEIIFLLSTVKVIFYSKARGSS